MINDVQNISFMMAAMPYHSARICKRSISLSLNMKIIISHCVSWQYLSIYPVVCTVRGQGAYFFCYLCSKCWRNPQYSACWSKRPSPRSEYISCWFKCLLSVSCGWSKCPSDPAGLLKCPLICSSCQFVQVKCPSGHLKE